MAVDKSSRAARKIEPIKSDHFTKLKLPLVVIFNHDVCIWVDRHCFPPELSKIFLKRYDTGTFSSGLAACLRWTAKLTPEKCNQLDYKIKQAKKFKASVWWIHNFMKRDPFQKVKGGREEDFFNQSRLFKERFKLKWALRNYIVSYIPNTEEVALIYRELPRQYTCDTAQAALYKPTGKQLYAILNVYTDGCKAPFTFIRKPKAPRTFPRNFDISRVLGVHCKAQNNAWNT